MPTVQKQERNHLFDLVKLICILIVVITHISWTESERNFFVFPLIIDMAIPLFLIISAFLRAKKIESIGLKNFISFKYSIVSFFNLIVAYIIVAFIEIIATLTLNHLGLNYDTSFLTSANDFFKWFITGLSGPGSYYVPIMIQLILFYPLIYLLFRKGRNKGILACFLLNLFYDIIVYFANLDPVVYRLLIFRYIFIIGLGVFLASSLKNKKEDIIAMVFLIVGLIYIIVNAYIFKFPLFDKWNRTSLFCAPYAYGIMYFLLKWFSKIRYQKWFVFGKASYYIYLTQMVFYYFSCNLLLNFTCSIVTAPLNKIIASAISIVLTFPVGLIFYYLDTKLRKLLHISR